jgi:hypothetical protein
MVYVKRDKEKQKKKKPKLMVTIIERMVDKKVGLWSQSQRQTHQCKFKAPSLEIQLETRRENKSYKCGKTGHCKRECPDWKR